MVETVDVVVVGGGNAGFVAAEAAATRGRKVLLLEKSIREESGGNSFYTAGATRVAHGGLASLAPILDFDERHGLTDVPPYSAEEYLADLERLTQGRADPALARVLVDESLSAVSWLHSLGMRFRLMYERQAYEQEGKYVFWGGLHVGNTDGGKGMMRTHAEIAERLGIDVRYDAAVQDLVSEGDRVVGVRGIRNGVEFEVGAESVIIASGSFEANPSLRRRYLGEGWQHAIVRGTPSNSGEMLEAALSIGAARGGDWSTAHSVQWDALFENNSGNRELTNQFTRQSYPLGILVDLDGRRFADEGEDFRNYTYAKLGREILGRPGGIAFQIFDAQTRPMLRTEEYEMPGVSELIAGSITDLASAAGIDADALQSTVTEFNDSIEREKPFDPTVLDGRRAETIPPKSNWALAIERPPFYAYPVACGITFCFGGLSADTTGRVLREDGTPITGLFAVGEALGGLFSGNYPGGSGLAAGTVFGRRAGQIA